MEVDDLCSSCADDVAMRHAALVRYARGKQRLLLWSGLCFCGLALSNVLVFIDLVLVPTVDLFLWRLAMGIIGMAFLLYGLIWERY